MAIKTLAVKYRPAEWQDLSGQDSIKVILDEQLKSSTFKNAYLFSGASGCGKTTSARIFANKINQGKGNPIEIDAASNSGVDNIRSINENAKKKSIESEYKIFIIDECHALSNSSWQAMLKTLEDCPRYTIFILCTTNPEKIPNTVLNRVQRYDFSKISDDKIIDRLTYICNKERLQAKFEALSYIARLSNGGMRDAISMLDKVSSLNKEITVENVVSSLGVVDYDLYFELSSAIMKLQLTNMLEIVQRVHSSGKDLKQFIKQFQYFMLDVCKYHLTGDFSLISIPQTAAYKAKLEQREYKSIQGLKQVLCDLIKINEAIKWESDVLHSVQSLFIPMCMDEISKEMDKQ